MTTQNPIFFSAFNWSINLTEVACIQLQDRFLFITLKNASDSIECDCENKEQADQIHEKIIKIFVAEMKVKWLVLREGKVAMALPDKTV